MGAGAAERGEQQWKERLDENIREFLDLSYHDGRGGDSTTAVRHWARFCGAAAADGSWVRALEEHATRHQKLEEEHLVMRFACWLVVERGVQPSTASKYISTVQGWHARRFGVRLAGGMQLGRVKALLKGMVMAQGGKKPRKKRLGLKPRQLARLMLVCLDGGTREEANWRACLEVGMCGLMRGAELGVADKGEWRPERCLTRADVEFRRRLGREVAVLWMRPAKRGAASEQGKRVAVLLTGGGRFLDPVKALRELFRLDPVPQAQWGVTPLFRGDGGEAFTTARIRGVVKWLVAWGGPMTRGSTALIRCASEGRRRRWRRGCRRW